MSGKEVVREGTLVASQPPQIPGPKEFACLQMEAKGVLVHPRVGQRRDGQVNLPAAGGRGHGCRFNPCAVRGTMAVQ